MLSNPRKWMRGAVAVAAATLLWFAALWIDSDAIYERLGMGMHAVTFLAIFVGLSAVAVALIFRRFARVREDLIAGRGVVAGWTVDEATFAAFAPKALADDAADKRMALLTIFGFVAVIFGAFAIYDPDVAGPMLAMAAALCVVVTLAWLLGGRVSAEHWVWRGGEALIGQGGLMFNGVLHVWSVPLSWLSSARLSDHPAALRVVYAYFSPRAGPQPIEVAIPVPPHAREAAGRAAAALRKR
jgi:hypothetical protein